MASHFPPHHPGEVCAAAQHLVANPKATVDELIEFLPGPDYPDPCTDRQRRRTRRNLPLGYRPDPGPRDVDGGGDPPGAPGGDHQPAVRQWLDRLGGGVHPRDRRCDRGRQAAGVDDVVNESAKGETRIAIELVKGVHPDQVIPGLLRATNLQVTNPVRMHALDVRGIPQLYNLRTALEAWIGHRVEVIERRSLRRIEIISERLHLLDGLLTVLLDIDAAIAIIRTSDDAAAAASG